MTRTKKNSASWLTPQRLNELWGVLLLAASVFVLMSLVSYHRDDLSFFTSDPSPEVRNACGVVGAFVAEVLRSSIGWSAFFLPFLGFFWAVACFSGKPVQRFKIKVISAILFTLSFSSFIAIIVDSSAAASIERGGIVGQMLGKQMLQYCDWWGAVIVLMTVAVLSLILSTELVVWPLLKAFGDWALKSFRAGWAGVSNAIAHLGKKQPASRAYTIQKPAVKPSAAQAAVVTKPAIKPKIEIKMPEPAPKVKTISSVPAPSVSTPKPAAPAKAVRVESSETKKPEEIKPPYQLPSLDLLNPPVPGTETVSQSKENLQASAKVLEDTLREFGIDARVAEVELGPVITRYEVEPAPGVKVQKITTLSDDLALAMKATSVRIIAPIPGKSRVGIEVPNSSSTKVMLREVLESPEFQNSKSKLTIALGKDSAGHPLIADLATMPHLLIAGATGSGKTVCMNSLIMSLLFRASPDEVRFLMVDPKMVELVPFNMLPHLVMPVMTNAKKVPAALNWAIEEMESRYRLFAKLGVRNIDGYNQKLAAGQLPAEEIPEHLPYIVIIIDELADLMMVAQAEIEKTICRLAQLSRAVGIHMVLATQRPSVDVLTGVIKANLPARISFQVASRVDSRTVLDAIGAEKLLGKGDLLFMPPGASKFTRGQGTLITDPEIDKVTQFIKAQRGPAYDGTILNEMESKAAVRIENTKDELYDEAVRVVVEGGQASVSLLQRRMRLGYGRAARIVDMMEAEGIVGPVRGAKPREVYQKDLPDSNAPAGQTAGRDEEES